MWVRMTLGIGIFTLPYYLSSFGLLLGLVFLMTGAFVCWISYRFIFEASFITEKKEYSELIKHTLHVNIYKVARITIFIEYCFCILVYTVVSWNLAEYLLYAFGVFNDDMLIDKSTMKFNEWHPFVFKTRCIFYCIVYVCLIPFLLKKNMEKLRWLSFCFLIVLCILIFYILFELPFFHASYSA